MATQRIGFLLVPGFSLSALSGATEPLRIANRVDQEELYRCDLISIDGRRVTSNGGFCLLPNLSIDDECEFSIVFIVSSLDAAKFQYQRAIDWLRDLAARGCKLGGLGCGTVLLARAGLLNGHHFTLPWQLLWDFVEEFPDTEVRRDLFCIDRDRLTSAGGTAGLDLILAFIEDQRGRETAIKVAEELAYTHIRPPEECQRMAVQWRYEVTDRRVVNCITLMEDNIEQPVPIVTLAHIVGLSPRELERVFKREFGCSPSRFYLELRLKRAQELLTHSTNSILSIALECGFSDGSHLGKYYREIFHQTPGCVRRSKRA